MAAVTSPAEQHECPKCGRMVHAALDSQVPVYQRGGQPVFARHRIHRVRRDGRYKNRVVPLTYSTEERCEGSGMEIPA